MTDRIRIGNFVRLRDGREGEVINLVRGADALRTKTEVQAILLDTQMRAQLGAEWLQSYYEATIALPDGIVDVTVIDVLDFWDA